MKTTMVWLFLFSAMFSSLAQSQNTSDCILALSLNSDLSTSHQVTEIYVKLLRQLTLTKNALSTAELELLRNQTVPVNPASFAENRMTSAERFSFLRGFSQLLTKAELLDWPKIKNEFEVILKEKRFAEEAREEAKSETEKVWASISKTKVSQVSEHSTVVASVVLPDEALIVLTKEDTFPSFSETFWLTDFSTGRRTELFSAESGEGEVQHLVLKDGSGLLSFTDGIHLAVFKIGADHQIVEVREKSLFEVKQSHSRRFKLLAMRESANGDPTLLVMVNDQGVTSFQEISLVTNKVQSLTQFRTSEPGTTYLLTDNGELVESKMSERDVTFRNLTRNEPAFTVTVPDGYSLFPSRAIKPSATELFMRYISPDQKLGWYDVKNKVFTPEEEMITKATLHVKQFETRYSMDETFRFSEVEIFHPGRPPKLYTVPTSFTSTRAKLLLTQAGVSYLAIGSNAKTLLSELPQLILLNLDTMEERKIELPSPAPSQFENIFETRDGKLEVLLDTQKGLELLQIFGPLN